MKETSVKKILVMGGTGAMGVHLCDMISHEGMQVTVTSRQTRENHGNIQYVTGNAKDASFMGGLLNRRWDTTEEFQKRADRLLESTDHYLFLSSARVYADSPEPITEESPRLLDVSKDEEYLKTDEYALSKARQENILFSSPYQNWTIIRPYITYDQNRLQFGTLEKEDWLFRVLSGKKVLFTQKMLEKKTTMTSGVDVAQQIWSIINRKDDTISQIYNTVGNQNHTWSEIYKIYNEVLNTHGYNLDLHICTDKEYIKCKLGTYQYKYDRLFDRLFFNKKISILAGNEIKNINNQKIKNALENFIQSPFFLDLNWSLEGKRDRLTNEYISPYKIPGIKNKLKYYKNRFARS
jgi:nucleoside-diphosphate-sugar epimerase